MPRVLILCEYPTLLGGERPDAGHDAGGGGGWI